LYDIATRSLTKTKWAKLQPQLRNSMPDWKHSGGHPPKTWLKQITVDFDTTLLTAICC